MSIQPIFREYIDGSKSFPRDFHGFPTDIINPNMKEFHFIVAFATEGKDQYGKGNGKFSRNWTVRDYDGGKIQNLKKSTKPVNVKVIISIGGRGVNYAFNPTDFDIWVDAAAESLKGIINDIGINMIDGIDINYDTIMTTENEFSTYIGKLIGKLKQSGLVHVVSIAPSYFVHSHYKTLYHHSRIDWVNYKFYTHNIPSTADFINLYHALANDYSHNNLLVGFSTDPNDQSRFSRPHFVEGCKDLVNKDKLPGIFLWNAVDSAAGGDPFYLENKAQRILTHSDDE